jgi:hypothetical protein
MSVSRIGDSARVQTVTRERRASLEKDDVQADRTRRSNWTERYAITAACFASGVLGRGTPRSASLQPVQSSWQRLIAKVDNRTPQDMAQCIDAQSRATVSIKEAQAKLAFMCIDTTFADAGDRMLAHERGHVTWKHIQELAQKGGINQDRLIVDFDLHDNGLRKDRQGFEIARWRSPRLIGSEVRPKSSLFLRHLKEVSKIYLLAFLADGNALQPAFATPWPT